MSTKNKPQNPLPCGCAAMGQMDLENAIDDGHSLHVGYKNTHVVFCALHLAAPDMLAVLKCAAMVIRAGSDLHNEMMAAIAKAEPPGGEGGGA